MSNHNPKLIDEHGRLKYGIHSKPVGEINYQDYPLRSALRDMLPLTERDQQFVHFHFIGFTSDDYIAGCSLSHADNRQSVFFYLFDRHTKTMLSRGCSVRENDHASINLNPDDGVSIIEGKGMSVRFVSKPQNMQKQLLVTLDQALVLDLNFAETPSRFKTLRLTTPTGPNGWTFAQKVAGIKASGRITVDEKSINLQDINATAHHDFTAGFLRRDTFWNWACLTGINPQGDLIGLNLSNSVNETGASENALWINGEREACAAMHFEYDLDDLSLPWTILSSDGRVNLRFKSEGHYAARQTAGPKPIDFTQLFGTFTGTISTLNGESLKIESLPGFCERQYAVWW